MSPVKAASALSFLSLNRPLPHAPLSVGMLLAVLLTASLMPAIAAADERTLAQSVYTSAQAQSGEPLYAIHCATCHETDYFRDVFRAWQGETMGMLFDVMAGTMPQSNPGSLYDQQYLDILAYVLQENDFPAGEDALATRGGALHDIVIVAP